MTYDEFEDSLIFMAKVGAGLATLLFIIAMFLLHGVANVMETRKPGFVLPFYIYGIFDIGFTIFWIFQYCTDALTKYEFAGLCAFLVILFFKIYFMGCVWSTYRQIQWEKSIKPLTGTLGMNLPPKYEEAIRNGDLPPAYVP
ncbi:lysosomal-associated transmembrane protein 4A-like [Oscarella lobularis]|uniref:lysosomal-associated transmembrane protein 4A-like n=1 Tax=Oscarella lobularis TaxID=121494 RepID=UPI003313F7A8